MGDGNPGCEDKPPSSIRLRDARHHPAISGMAVVLSEVCAVPDDHQLVLAMITFREGGEVYIRTRAHNGKGPEVECSPVTLAAEDSLVTFFQTAIAAMLKRPHPSGRITGYREAHLKAGVPELVLVDPVYDRSHR